MEAAVKRALGTTVFNPTGRGGSGCISEGSSYVTDKGTVFVKINTNSNALAVFEGEKASLDAIVATEAIKCPKPLTIVKDGPSNLALVMESVNMSPSMTSKEQEKLGEQLARMHLHNKTLIERFGTDQARTHSREDEGDGPPDLTKPVTKFGFHCDTCCGKISQDNRWQDDWTTFYVNQKLQPQVDMIMNKKGGDRDLKEIWPLCREKVEKYLGMVKEDIVPALLHGDLWSGNVAASSKDGEPVIYDPSSFYGHSEFDFGIANMFGGFTSSFFNAYFKVIPKTEGFEYREAIYELFHHLNHWNHFGTSYKGGTISLMRKISKFP